MAGNSLGPKSKVQYVADNGSTYILRIDDDLIISSSGLVLGTTGGTKPSRFKARGVFAQHVTATGRVLRKFLVCGAADAALYATNTPQVVTIDTLAFTTTGRRGEVQTFA